MKTLRHGEADPQAGEAAGTLQGRYPRQLTALHAGMRQNLLDHRQQLLRGTAER